MPFGIVDIIVILLALTALYTADEASAGFEAGGNAVYCHWYRQQAKNTGDETGGIGCADVCAVTIGNG